MDDINVQRELTSVRQVSKFYQNKWQKFNQWWNISDAYSLHLGLYEKGIRNHVQALNNMSDYVGRLLGLESEKSYRILDAGCGVGGPLTFLAMKYSDIQFTGINISDEQLDIAINLAKKRNVRDNTEFLYDNYNKTQFPDDYFDGIFFLDSMSHSVNKSDLIYEMYRILKPNGRIVFIEGFLCDKPFNSFTQKLYNVWQTVKGYPYLPSLEYFNSLLESTGFTNIVVRDITKNISFSMIRATIIGFPYLYLSIIKRIFQGKDYNPSKDENFYMGSVVIEDILGLMKFFKYCSLTAIKNASY